MSQGQTTDTSAQSPLFLRVFSVVVMILWTVMLVLLAGLSVIPVTRILGGVPIAIEVILLIPMPISLAVIQWRGQGHALMSSLLPGAIGAVIVFVAFMILTFASHLAPPLSNTIVIILIALEWLGVALLGLFVLLFIRALIGALPARMRPSA